MSSLPEVAPKPKKSVALSGVTAGNTALCTVGRTGNDLHYRGYDILDVAERCEFEEIAYLLVHERLPSAAELKAYKQKLRSEQEFEKAKQARDHAKEELKAAQDKLKFFRMDNITVRSPQRGKVLQLHVGSGPSRSTK